MSSSPTTPPKPACPGLSPLPSRSLHSQTKEPTTENALDQSYDSNCPLDEPNEQKEGSRARVLSQSDAGEHPTHSDPLLGPSDRLLDPKDLCSDKRSKRPLSYPWGPDSKPDSHTVDFKLSTSQSDPLKSSLTRSRTQVKPFTRESLERLEKKTLQLVREYGFTPRKKLSVEDGSRLPTKFEPFPPHLYGRPLEEIDNFIYDEVKFNVVSQYHENTSKFQKHYTRYKISLNCA